MRATSKVSRLVWVAYPDTHLSKLPYDKAASPVKRIDAFRIDDSGRWVAARKIKAAPFHRGHYIKSIKNYSVRVPVYETLGKSTYETFYERK